MEKIRNYKENNGSSFISEVVFLISLWFVRPTVSAQVITFPGDAREGKLVFENKGCKNCH